MTSSKVFMAAGNDAGIAAASVAARASFKYFWRELTWEYRRIIPGLELSAVKAKFADPGREGDAEHMWLGDVAFDGDVVEATLLNQPNKVRSVKEGDVVVLCVEDLEDWMYAIDGRVYGGFTIQAMRVEMSPADRRSHDAAWGFDFGVAGETVLVPDWNAKKPGLLDRVFRRSVAPAAESAGLESEHPMSENMAAEFAKAIDANPNGFLHEVGRDGLTTLHSLALGGSAGCVRVLLEKGADPSVRTPSGKTALDLARQMGWPRVVALLDRGQA